MSAQYFDSAIPATGGYPQLSGGPFGKPIETDIMMAKLYKETVFRQVTNMDYMSDLAKAGMGDTIEFVRPGEAQINEYQKNQKLEFQTVNMEKFQLGLDRACYYAFKEDKLDNYMFGPKLDKMRRYHMDQAKQKIDLQVGKEFFGEMYTSAASHNKGKEAGKQSGSFNLGAVNAPVVMNEADVLKILMNVDTVLDEALCPEAGRFIVLPTKAKVPFMNNDKIACANQSGHGNSYLDNYVGNQIQVGNLTVMFSPHIESVIDPGTGNAAYNVLAGNKDATAFAMAFICEDDAMTDVDYFGLHWRYLLAYGMGVMRPECLVHLYAQIDV